MYVFLQRFSKYGAWPKCRSWRVKKCVATKLFKSVETTTFFHFFLFVIERVINDTLIRKIYKSGSKILWRDCYVDKLVENFILTNHKWRWDKRKRFSHWCRFEARVVTNVESANHSSGLDQPPPLLLPLSCIDGIPIQQERSKKKRRSSPQCIF